MFLSRLSAVLGTRLRIAWLVLSLVAQLMPAAHASSALAGLYCGQGSSAFLQQAVQNLPAELLAEFGLDKAANQYQAKCDLCCLSGVDKYGLPESTEISNQYALRTAALIQLEPSRLSSNEYLYLPHSRAPPAL